MPARLALVVGLAVLALLVAGCGATKTYSADDVTTAFAGHGFPLVAAKLPVSAAALQGKVLRLPGRNQLAVYVADSDGDTATAWASYVKVGSAGGSFDAMRANVMAISDGGLSKDEIRRVKAAMEDLPDHGDAVATLGPSP